MYLCYLLWIFNFVDFFFIVAMFKFVAWYLNLLVSENFRSSIIFVVVNKYPFSSPNNSQYPTSFVMIKI